MVHDGVFRIRPLLKKDTPQRMGNPDIKCGSRMGESEAVLPVRLSVMCFDCRRAGMENYGSKILAT